MPFTIHIVNPNSSQAMTDALEPIIADLRSEELTIELSTGPRSAPPSIDDYSTSVLSAAHTFEALRPSLRSAARADAYLVACFSDHPLVEMIREHAGGAVRVLGILEAAVRRALALARPFAIVTTGAYWEGALAAGVARIFGPGRCGGLFVGVQSTGLTAGELHVADAELVRARIAEATRVVVGKGARSVIMGCAGMAGMDDAVRRGAGDVDVHIVDGVRSGVEVLQRGVAM